MNTVTLIYTEIVGAAPVYAPFAASKGAIFAVNVDGSIIAISRYSAIDTYYYGHPQLPESMTWQLMEYPPLKPSITYVGAGVQMSPPALLERIGWHIAVLATLEWTPPIWPPAAPSNPLSLIVA